MTCAPPCVSVPGPPERTDSPVKLRLLAWLRDCSASIALLVLGAILFGAPPPTVAAAAGSYLSYPAIADEAVKQRLIRAEVIRGLRGGRSAADGPSESPSGLPPDPPRRAPLQAAVVAGGAAPGEAFALATAHHRPAPTGPPRIG